MKSSFRQRFHFYQQFLAWTILFKWHKAPNEHDLSSTNGRSNRSPQLDFGTIHALIRSSPSFRLVSILVPRRMILQQNHTFEHRCFAFRSGLRKTTTHDNTVLIGNFSHWCCWSYADNQDRAAHDFATQITQSPGGHENCSWQALPRCTVCRWWLGLCPPSSLPPDIAGFQVHQAFQALLWSLPGAGTCGTYGLQTSVAFFISPSPDFSCFLLEASSRTITNHISNATTHRRQP